MAVSRLPAPPRRVLESFPEPPRAILERSETPPEHHKCVLEAINVSKRAPGRSKSRSGSSKDSLCKLSSIESASFPASISTFVACPSKKQPLRLRCGLCVPPRLRSPIGLGGGREAQTISKLLTGFVGAKLPVHFRSAAVPRGKLVPSPEGARNFSYFPGASVLSSLLSSLPSSGCNNRRKGGSAA